MTKEMTHGSPTRLILSFTIPLMLGNIFQQLYSMVDTAIVGRILGTDALAAVGATGSVTFLIIGFCLGLCSGFAIPLAQCFGRRDYAELRRYLGNAILLLCLFGLLITVLTVLFCRNILELMGTPEDIIDEAYAYLVVIFAGIPATLLYNMISGIQRALGDSRTPMLFLVAASVINVVLDIVLIVFIPMGVAGAAVATIVSQLVGGIACLIFAIRHYNVIHLSKEDLRPRMEYIGPLMNMGLPMALQTSITAIGSVILQSSVNALGTTAVASATAGSKIYYFFDSICGAMGVTMSNYGGQNIGAKKYDRIDKGLRSCCIIGVIYSLIGLAVILLCGRWLLQIFVDPSETAILDGAYHYLFINGCFLTPLMLVNVVRLTIQGIGFSKIAMFAGVFEMIARGLTGMLLVPAFGFTAACLAGPIAWLMADSFLIPAYFAVMRRVRRNEGAA